MSAPDASSTPVTLYFPYTMDISGLNATLFGEAVVDMSGDLIPVETHLTLGSLYDSGAGASWIHYIQDASENTYRAAINQVKAAALNADLSGAVNQTAGATYSASSQSNASALDVSGAAPFNGAGISAPWLAYNSLQDMVVSYFALKILGHPGALAAISNDSVLRTAATAAIVAGFEQVYGDSDVAVQTHVGLTDFASKATVNTGYTHGYAAAPGIMTEADCLALIENMMNLDPIRFNSQDKNKWQPLVFVDGDKLRMQVKFSNNTYTVKSGGTSAIASGTAQAVPGASELYYLLEFTVSP